LDGTDFKIYEPSPFDRKWYSFKHHGPGVRYEIGLCIKTGKIVWAFGGVPCGAFTDLRLARHLFVDSLKDGERALADRGYRDFHFITPYGVDLIPAVRQKEIMARHETVNRRLKQFKVLGDRFRHEVTKHPICFHAVVNITELMIINGHPLYTVH
jgi:DDE superfamily endonuclease